PSPNAAPVLTALSIAPAAPAAPTFNSPTGRLFLAKHSQLSATRDGQFIAGVNAPVNGAGTVYLYESASHTILRSRLVANATPTIAISDDGARIQSGAILFDATSLRILATQNTINSPYPITPGTVFTAAVVQGGAAFGPDNTLYAAYNVPPVQAST